MGGQGHTIFVAGKQASRLRLKLDEDLFNHPRKAGCGEASVASAIETMSWNNWGMRIHPRCGEASVASAIETPFEFGDGLSEFIGCGEASVASAIETAAWTYPRSSCSGVAGKQASRLRLKQEMRASCVVARFVAGKQASRLRLKQTFNLNAGQNTLRCGEASVASAIETPA